MGIGAVGARGSTLTDEPGTFCFPVAPVAVPSFPLFFLDLDCPGLLLIALRGGSLSESSESSMGRLRFFSRALRR